MELENKSIIKNLLEVSKKENVLSKEVKFISNNVNISFNLRKLGKNEFEAYITAENKDIEKAVKELEKIRDSLSNSSKPVSTQKDNKWAEIRFGVDPENIQDL